MSEETSLEPLSQEICRQNNWNWIKSIGAGAFKETFLIADSSNNTSALKLYKPGFSDERTLREIAAMKKCNHLNVCRLQAVERYKNSTTDCIYTLEEFIDGGTLNVAIQSSKLLSNEQVFEIGLGLISAIKHISEKGLVHRDIKPDNIMLRTSGTPVLVDLGLVRDLNESSLTQSWAMRGPGTPYYASPEQLNNEKSGIDWRSDQFGLGVVLSHLLFGMHPYGDTSDHPRLIVERVAARTFQHDLFLKRANDQGFPLLVQMTKPWAIERIRKPEELLNLWQEQRRK